MRYKAICLTIFSMLSLINSAAALTVCGELKQGGFVKVSADNLQKIEWNGKTYKADDSGNLALAFGRDENLQQKMTVYYTNSAPREIALNLNKTEWDVQDIKGIEPAKVTPSESDYKAIERESSALGKALKFTSITENWLQTPIKPVDGRTSGNFGGQRIMNGVKKNPHQGWDIAAPLGTEVKAALGGTVTLSDGPFFYSGNVIVLEHGQNLSTIYAHLQKILVKEGQHIEKGQVIGLVGNTGRVTGPHLHFGASLNGVRFDARNLLENTKKCIEITDIKGKQ